MPDEVAGDDSGIALDANLRRKLAREARLRREITDEFLRDMFQADASMRSGKRGAAQFAAAKTALFVQRLAALDRDLGRFTGPAPDMVLARIAHALAGLEEGLDDPILKPADDRRSVVDAETGLRRGVKVGLAVNVEVARATAAAAIEILMLAGLALTAAAQEVAKILRDHPLLAGTTAKPAREVARWREEIKKRSKKRELPDMRGQSIDFRTQAAGQFNFLVGEAKRLKQDGAPPEALVRIAHDLLGQGLGMGEGGNSDLARAKSERPEV
jgi:hypothetical protein